MIRRTPNRRRFRARAGAILLVVLTLLALFAVVGLSFALYAQSEATAARIKREAANAESKPDPYPAINAFLGQLLFDTSDTGPDAMSAVRGHSLGRGKYGYLTDPANPGNLYRPMTAAYVGTGPFAEALSLPDGTSTNRDAIINYAFYPNPNPVNQYIIDPEWQGGIRTGPTVARTGAFYKGKNANYTYPDLNNAYLAIVDPKTGAVVQPSFHRNWLFDFNNPGASWTDAAGRLKILRPRPTDHTAAFPLPPMNPDGTVTGDVQNLRYANGLQKNDSIWLDVNAPVFDYKGKKVKALIAPLILDLNARVNVNVAQAGTTNGLNPADPNYRKLNSSMGFGPHEINLAQLLLGTQTAAEIDAARAAKYGQTYVQLPGYTATPYNPPSDRYTNQAMAQWNPWNGSSRTPPLYGSVAWNSTTAPTAKPLLPAAGGLSPFPTFPDGSRYIGSNGTETVTAQQSNHPLQYNPAHWPTITGATAPTPATAHAFGPDELKLLFSRFSTGTARKPATELTSIFATNLGATAPAASGDAQARAFGGMALTTYSTTVNQPSLTAINNALRIVRLPPIDLARDLPDYRRDPSLPVRFDNILSPVPNSAVGSDYGKYAKARQARQNFARDVFVRLVAVARYSPTGTPPAFSPVMDGFTVSYNPATGYLNLNNPPPPQLNALRQCAQAAVNIVDYLDGDDVMTTFVWNPTLSGTGYVYNDATAATSLGVTAFPDPSGPDPQLTAALSTGQGVRPVQNSVVFGYELPRLVINEALATVTNDRSETSPSMPPMVGPNRVPQQNFKKKFWAELMNPLPADDDQALLVGGGPTAVGGVAQLQVKAALNTGAAGDYSPYQLQVFDYTPGPVTALAFLQQDAGNITGNFELTGGPLPPLGTKRVEITDYTAAAGGIDSTWAGGANANNYTVKPLGTSTTYPPNATTSNKGYFVIGPQDDPPDAGPMSPVYVSSRLPDTNPSLPLNILQVDTGVKDRPGLGNLTARSNCFVLRRLANPYSLPNEPGPTFNANLPPNPYVTVDVFDQVPTADRVEYAGDKPAARVLHPTDGTEILLQPNNTGTKIKRHPYAALNTDFSGTAPPAQGSRPAVDTSFFLPEPKADNAQGLQWLAHLDRPPVNALELAGVAFVSPSLVTTQFYTAPNTYQTHTAAGGWTGTAVPGDPFFNLFKTLDVLTVRSRLAGIPVGGPEPGKVNPNTIWDEWAVPGGGNVSRVLMAVADPTQANQFANTDVYRMWADIKAARTLTGTSAGKAVTDDTTGTAGTDRPFRGFNTTTDQIQDTLLRPSTAPSTNAPAAIFSLNPTPGTNSHPLFQSEPLRKMLNSLTPTSDSFLVLVTVGFFEVDMKNAKITGTFTLPLLGKEIHDEIPGDLRVQFGTVVDRGMMTVKDVDSLANATTPGTAPWFTAVAADVGPDDPAVPGYNGQIPLTVAGSFDGANNAALIYSNGQPVRVVANDPNPIRVGFGDLNSTISWGGTIGDSTDGEWVNVRSVANGPANSGTVILTVARKDGDTTRPVFSRPHPVGSPVSNAVLGNPGPDSLWPITQPKFDFTKPQWRGLVPYYTDVTRAGAFPVPKP